MARRRVRLAYQCLTTTTPLTDGVPQIIVHSTLRRWGLEDSRRTTRSIPLQVPQHRIHEQDIPPQYR